MTTEGRDRIANVDRVIATVTERVLAVEYPSSITPAHDGSGFAVAWRSPSRDACRLYRAGGQEVATIPGAGTVSWHAGGFVTVLHGTLYRYSVNGLPPRPLAVVGSKQVAAAHGDDLWLKDKNVLYRLGPDGDTELQAELDAVAVSGLSVSTDGGVFAVRTVEPAGDSSLRLHARDGAEVLRWYEPSWCVLGAAFAGSSRLLVTRMTKDSTARQVALLDLASGDRQLLLEEISEKGFVRLPAAIASGRHAAYIRYVDGWPLLCVYHLEDRSETVANPGAQEDLTDIADFPVFSPDGRHVAFNSSAADLRERHLYVFDTRTGVSRRLSSAPGATAAKAWLTDQSLVFVESHARRGAALRLVHLSGDSTRTLASRRSGRGVIPRPIELEVDGRKVPADLYLPEGTADGDDRPAVVYAHGGVFRQLTRGYPASYGYTLLHEVNLGLLELGFVVVSVEYRGSMGFGLEYEQANYQACGVADTADCAAAARFLASRPFIDPARIGIWGLSWGGTLTLCALVRYPELFQAGVSVAGIWDFEQRAQYWNALQSGQPIYFDGRMGARGNPARQLASARNMVNDLRAPLLSLHGTRDESVDYAQQALLSADARRLGKTVEAITFEGESHVFNSAPAWQRAVPAIIQFLHQHLGPPQTS